MNTSILNRCIDELKGEKPDISYVRGALEALLELSQADIAAPIRMPAAAFPHPHGPNIRSTEVTRTEDVTDEEDPNASAYLRGDTGRVTETNRG